MKNLFAVAVVCLLFAFMEETSAAEKIRVGVVSPAPGLSAPWIAKETGGFAKHGLDADVILLTGSPRLAQSLIAGDVHHALVGAAAVMRARMRGAEVVILGAAANVSSQKLVVNPKSGIRHFSISQNGRAYSWHTNTFPVPRELIETHSANMHMILADTEIESQLKSIRPGNMVHLKGLLVEVTSKEGFRWKSSLTRADTGGGACELILVESLYVW
ncbi:MAG TPA: ABC transporter substrate-binding protein [Candidatus Binatia bacterium]|jgi:hypothetical protein|nr:ABC transporter substrate-binding protein [Candidatus Binatia bacterium]